MLYEAAVHEKVLVDTSTSRGFDLHEAHLLPQHTVAPKSQCGQTRVLLPDFGAAAHMQTQPHSLVWLLGSPHIVCFLLVAAAELLSGLVEQRLCTLK